MATIAERLESIWSERPGLYTFLHTIDHKKLGVKYIVTAAIFFVLGGIESLILRVQLADANLRVVDPETFNQLFSMHGVTMMFLFALPMLSGFGIYFIPLMIGTRELAFPRLNAFSYWALVAAGLFMYSAFLIGQAPNDGWFNYVPFALPEYNPHLNIDFYGLGLIFLGFSTTAGAINFIVTILKMRAPGMSLNRMPIFIWGELGMALSVILALPALTAATVMLELERKFGFPFFTPSKGGDPILWQHLFWIFGHPMVYIVVLPALGMASTIIPTFSRRPMVGYTYIVLAEMATALIGFGVWAHHMFAIGLPQLNLAFFSAASLIIVIPSGTQIFAWLATMFAGKVVLKTPMLFTIGFIFVFVIGGLTGAMLGSVPFDQQAHDSYFVVAHLHYVLVGGMVFPLFGVLYYWLPKITGKLMSESLGKLSFWVMFVGFNLAFFPMHISGLLGQPRRTFTYEPGLGWDIHNLISTIGAFMLTVGIGMTIWNIFSSIRKGNPAGNDPWKSETLEWATTSPPPDYNFAALPTVESRTPLWDQPELSGGAGPPPDHPKAWPLAGGHVALSTSVMDASPQAIIDLPHESPWPFALTVAMTVLFFAFLVDAWPVAIAAVVACAGCVIGWFLPAEHLRAQHQETS
ncbi:MAG TPA: cytochrome c oxidase subunit I [Actinomycetota bacterium]